MSNSIVVCGRLGRDPEERMTSSSQKLYSLTLATTRRKAGKDETVWYNITIWGDQFAGMIRTLRKGSAIMVTGTLDARLYEKDGQTRLSLDITATNLSFLPTNSNTSQEGLGGEKNMNRSAAYTTSNAGFSSSTEMDEDLTFTPF